MGGETALPSPFKAEPLAAPPTCWRPHRCHLDVLELAPISLRVRAAMIDHLLVVAVTAAVIVEAIINNRHRLAISVPPPLGGSSSNPLFRNIAVPVLVLATWLGLAHLEARHGRTPGKTLVGLRAVSDDGTPITLRQSLTRRAIIQALVGPRKGASSLLRPSRSLRILVTSSTRR